MSWPTPVAFGDDLFCISSGYPLRKLIDEINDRIAVASSSSYWTGPITCSAGDDATTLKLWNDFRTSGGVPIHNAIDSILWGGDHTGGFAGLLGQYQMPGSLPGTPIQTQPARAHLGLPTTYYYFPAIFGAGFTRGDDNRVMRRRRYRRLAASFFGTPATATQDDQGNSATAGQWALDSAGKLWRCVASGNWVRDESGTPDILDNTQDRPNTVAEYTYSFYGTNPARPQGYWNDGQVQPGDILGWWIFEERRQLLELATTLL